MRRILRVPAMDLREGDLVSFHIFTRYASNQGESVVTKSYQCLDNDGTWYLAFEDERYNQFADMCEQFTLLQEVRI